MNPIDKFKKVQSEHALLKKDNEQQLIQKWQKTQDPAHLQELVNIYKPLIEHKVRQYKAPGVPESSMKAELLKHFHTALTTYDPTRGTAPNTHIENAMRKAIRYNTKYQNIAYIPEGQVGHIAPIQQAQNLLHEQLGFPPSPAQIAEHLNMPLKTVNRVLKAQRKDVAASAFENDPQLNMLSRNEEVLSLLPFALNSDKERDVFHRIYGDQKHTYPGSMTALAKQMGLSNSQLSRVHTSILNTAKQYMK